MAYYLVVPFPPIKSPCHCFLFNPPPWIIVSTLEIRSCILSPFEQFTDKVYSMYYPNRK